MNYEEFVLTVKEELSRLYTDEAQVEIRQFSKNNMEREDAVCVLRRSSSISPIVYLKPVYAEYQGGKRMVDILADIVQVVDRGDELDIPVEKLSDWNYVKDTIGAKLIPVESNREYLRGLPHREYMDLAVVYYMLFDPETSQAGTAVVTWEAMKSWEISEEELYEQSRQNLPVIMTPRVFCMEDMIEELSSGRTGTAVDLLSCGRREAFSNLYVVTNDRRWMGAISVFCDGVLDHFLEIMGWDAAYLIPSSIHEMLILPVLEADELRLREMVAEVNETTVDPEDRLSYSIYRYDRDDAVLRRIESEANETGRLFAVSVM